MSLIPDFDHNHVLPPHTGNPAAFGDVSPYLCSVSDFCNKFSTSTKRIEILINFIEFRLKIYDLGIVGGFQWVDGSFVENIETSERRDPKDIDVLTFYHTFTNDSFNTIVSTTFKEFASNKLSKEKFMIDHYPMHYSSNPHTTVELTKYWVQLFTHTRNGVWKGIIRLEFVSKLEDETVLTELKSKL